MNISAQMTDTETAAALYLAGVSMWHDEPECPSIGAPGPKSKSMTEDMIFHLALCGHLRPPKRTVRRWIADKLRLIWRRWELFCEDEPIRRNHRPSIFNGNEE